MRIEDQLVLELFQEKKNPEYIESLAASGKFNTAYFLKIIDKNLISAAALTKILKYNLPPAMKERLSAVAKDTVIDTTLRNRLFREELDSILSLLKQNEIDSIVMKGFTIDTSGIRNNRDLDILIREDDLFKAIEALKSVNYEYIGNIINLVLNSREKKDISAQLSWNNQYQLIKEGSGLLLELHTNLFERRRVYGINLDALLDNIDIFWERRVWDDKLKAFKFGSEDLLLLMCMQNAIKKSPSGNGFRLRTLIDIRNIVSGGIDWGILLESAARFGIASFAYFSLSMASDLLGVNIPGDVLNGLKSRCSKSRLFMEKIHRLSFHSLESSDIFFSNIYKMFSPFVYGAPLYFKLKRLLLIPVLFPPRSRMEEMYRMRSGFVIFTYLINPFRWIYLIIKRHPRRNNP